MTVTGERPAIVRENVDFNRRNHPDRPLRPIPPGRDNFAAQWRQMREFMFGEWIDIDKEVEPNEMTRLRDDYFWQGDEYMVGVVDAFERIGHEKGRAMFEQALTQGIDTVDDPRRNWSTSSNILISCRASSISSPPSGAGCWRCRALQRRPRSSADGRYTRPR